MRISKYYERDIFTDEWFEVPGKHFHDFIVEFRDCFDMRYEDNGNTLIFSSKLNGYDCFKRLYSEKGGN